MTSAWIGKEAKKVCSLMLLVFQSFWFERNNRVFHNKAKTEEELLDVIMVETERWKTVGFL